MRKIAEVLRPSWRCRKKQRQGCLQCRIFRPRVGEYLLAFPTLFQQSYFNLICALKEMVYHALTVSTNSDSLSFARLIHSIQGGGGPFNVRLLATGRLNCLLLHVITYASALKRISPSPNLPGQAENQCRHSNLQDSFCRPEPQLFQNQCIHSDQTKGFCY